MSVTVKCPNPKCGRYVEANRSRGGTVLLLKCVCGYAWQEKLEPQGGARWIVLALLVGLGAAFALGAYACPREVEVVRYDRVTVSPEAILDQMPDSTPGRVDRILNPVVEPEQIAVARGAALEDVDAFCRAGGFVRRAENQDGADAPTQPTAETPPVLPKSFGVRDGDALTLSLPLSNGDRPAFHYQIKGDRYTWVTSGDSIVAQGRRFWWVGPCAGDLALGGGAGSGGAAITGGDVGMGGIVGLAAGGVRCVWRFR